MSKDTKTTEENTIQPFDDKAVSLEDRWNQISALDGLTPIDEDGNEITPQDTQPQ